MGCVVLWHRVNTIQDWLNLNFELSSNCRTNVREWKKQVIMPMDPYVTVEVNILNEMEKSCCYCDDILKWWSDGRADEAESKLWATSFTFTYFCSSHLIKLSNKNCTQYERSTSSSRYIIHIVMLFVFNAPQNQDSSNIFVYTTSVCLCIFGWWHS